MQYRTSLRFRPRPRYVLTSSLVLSLIFFLIFALTATPTMAGQTSDPKTGFVQALGRFSLELDGTYGDEGDRLISSLAAMEQGLQQWDEAIRAYEAATSAQLVGAPPQLAARVYMSRAGIYLERGRLEDGLRALAMAAELAPGRVDVYTLQGLTYSQLADRPDAADATTPARADEAERRRRSATEAFRQASALDPADPVPAYVLAHHLRKIGAEQEALDARRLFVAAWEAREAGPERGTPVASPFIRLGLIQEATDVEPFFPPAPYAEGFALLRQGAYQRAIARFRDAVARDPLTANPGAGADAMRRAAAAFRDGAVEIAAGHLETAIERSPDHAEPYRVLGSVYEADLQYEKAIDALRTSIGLNPADERARLALAFALAETNQYAAAEQALTDTLQVFPDSGRARYSLASLYERQEMNVDAVREFEAAVTLHPLSGLNRLYRTIGRIHFELRDVVRTIEAYERRVDLLPNDGLGHLLLGQAYEEQGRDEEALTEFAVALLMNPDDGEAQAAIGNAYLGVGEFARAVDAARRALDADPTLKEPRYALATALMRLGRTDEGRQELQLYQRLQAEDTAARTRDYELSGLRREASVSVTNQDYGQAVALLRQALLLDPASATSHMSLGLALLGAGQFGEAIERLETAAALNAPADVHRHLADAYAALGRDDDSQREQAIYERMRREASSPNR